MSNPLGVPAAITLVVIGILFLMAVGPWLTLNALNVLFGLDLPITWTTYGAALWLSMIVYGSTEKCRHKN
jgi:hypothetical protein